ncbi:MAG: asparaginase domain-containing protein [Pseudomonadota bacterium]
MKVNIVTTGGTIDKIYFDAKSDYQIGDPVIGKLLQRMGVVVDYEVHALMRKDSLELTDIDRHTIAAKVKSVDSDYVLVTHGTDTMVDTGRCLREQVPDKRIVLTGALQPAAFRETDAVFNIGCALGALQMVDNGVFIAMNGRVFDVMHVRKNVSANRFEST